MVSLRTKITLVIFSFFVFLILLEAGLRLGGFIVLSLQERRNEQSIRRKGSYRVMCVGESTTANQYPVFLEEILNQRHAGIRFSVIDKGIVAITTVVILAQIESNLDKYHPDMVVAMMGVNDATPHILYEASAASRITLFLKTFRTYKLTRLLWLHIITKTREMRLYSSTRDTPHPGKTQSSFLIKEASPEQTSEDSFKKAIELNPRHDGAYIGLGFFYWRQGRLAQAEDSFKKAIELNPLNDRAYTGLGWVYWNQANYSQAEDPFKKAIELNPRNDRAYTGLGWAYWRQGRLSQAEESFKKAIELKPQDDSAYVAFGWFYHDQGRLSQAEESFKKVIELDPRNDRAYGALSVLYAERGKPELAREYAQKANRLRLGWYNPITVSNYRKLKDILDKRGVKLVCVQEPMCSIELLKRIFQGREEEIIFVDNERVFRDAVEKDGYNVYFKDMFGGDFGHCTNKGNRLLAENIADAILKEVFHK